MECFEDHVNLRLIYKNHQIWLDFFDRVQIDEIQHRTRKNTILKLYKQIASKLYFAFDFKQW